MSLADPVKPNTFVNGATEVIDAPEVNANFDTIYAAVVASNAVINAATATKTNDTIVLRNGSGAAALDVTGNVTGNVIGNVTGSSGSCTGNAATATSATTSTNATGTGSIPLARYENSLRIVRGTIASNATVGVGSGFSVAREGGQPTGVYRITFTNAFSALPSACANISGFGAVYKGACVIGGKDTGFATVYCYTDGGALQDAPFDFIVIGPN